MSKWTLADQIGEEAAARIEAERAKAGPRVFITPADHLPPYMPTVILQGMMLGFAAIMLTAVYFNVLLLQLMQRVASGSVMTQEEYEFAADPILQWVGIVTPLVITAFVLCVIAYLNFVYFAARNLERAWAAGFTHSPWGAVGLSFIPLANFFLIPKVMHDIWVSSNDPRHGAIQATPLLAAWWILYVVGNFGTRILGAVMRGGRGEGSIDDTAAYIWAESALSIVIAISCLLLFRIVGQIRHAQANWTDPPADTPTDPVPLAADAIA